MLGGKTLPWAFAKHGFAFGKTQVWRVENIRGFGHRSTQRKWWWQEINEIFRRRKAGAFFIIQRCLEEAKNSKNLRNCLRKTWSCGGWEEIWLVGITKEKSNTVGKGPQLNALCRIQRNSFVNVMWTKFLPACARFTRIHRFWGKFSGGLSPRSLRTIIGFNFMPNIHFSKGGECAVRAWLWVGSTNSRHSTLITAKADQNWNSPLFSSTFCRNCTNYEAWLVTITFAWKFDRLIIRGVWMIILKVWNSTQNMATLLLGARV